MIYLFTTNFPYGKGETFLETEISFLSEKSEVTIIPLFISEDKRETPVNVKVAEPLLSFNPKSKGKLIKAGICNFSPLFFAFSEFCYKKVFLSKTKIWNFNTSFLLFRAIYKNVNINFSENDILYFYWADKSALILPFLKKKYAFKSVVRFHGSDLYEAAKSGYIPFREQTFKAIDTACPISENGANYLREKYKNKAPKEIIVSRLGVLKQGENPENNSEIFHLLSCSNVIPLKRVHLIAKALQYIDFQIKWTHIGDGVNFEKLKKEVENLPKNVEVNLLGSMPNEDVMQFYRENPIDLFINVSESEGIPVSMMEVLAFGIPVMATNVGGVAEIVDEKIGVLLDKKIDEKELEKQIIAFKNNPTNCLKRAEAIKKWDEKYNASNNYTFFVENILHK